MTTLDASTVSWPKTCLTARKTKPIRVKLLRDIMRADDVIGKFLLQTLEGIQAINDQAGTMVCIGVGSDVWQQPKKKVLGKYTITDIDDNGWLMCAPKPDVAVNCFEVLVPKFKVKTQWGTKNEEDGTYEQFGEGGDYVCQSQSDPTDFWIVKRKIFNSTYEIQA